MSTWIGRELRAKDLKDLPAFIARAPRPASLFVRAALARGDTDASWWYGVFRGGQSLEAVMAVHNHQGALYAANDEAARGLADELYAQQRRLGPSSGQTHRHQLLGEAKTMGIVWPIMRDLPGRKLVFDKDCDLLQAPSPASTDLPAPSSRVVFDLARPADERVVSDFIAELRIEQLGVDPRKLARDAHMHRVAELLTHGRALIAKEKDSGRPFFVAELAPLTDDTALLSDVYVPPHYRARGKLIAQAFWASARHACAHVPPDAERVYLASDPTFGNAAKTAGWQRISGYRWCVTHG